MRPRLSLVWTMIYYWWFAGFSETSKCGKLSIFLSWLALLTVLQWIKVIHLEIQRVSSSYFCIAVSLGSVQMCIGNHRMNAFYYNYSPSSGRIGRQGFAHYWELSPTFAKWNDVLRGRILSTTFDTFDFVLGSALLGAYYVNCSSMAKRKQHQKQVYASYRFSILTFPSDLDLRWWFFFLLKKDDEDLPDPAPPPPPLPEPSIVTCSFLAALN